ncbi:uncharacterized protein FFUJ_14143 [Fusarium fujikuroi IMI 58289]|uniref:Uncharacterized protein n=1 Tax=Gibberella fujikuroi (strain CBS 195.34 / IMI 58289 / NRRL A-6831) TaxID=1279085 RepID=S0EMD2_GIBF5|nr:uncharacterized protein FFUJ_14143 [Fusarium fujikuroi IMI 58289]KLP16868.1 uncharacterized protein LW94_9385 [Fusarium fujikuroi]CCT76223.1 uncharacterized protein FFUJ_14143 [Fusarium fujikuroi IMI 58289]SCO58602.1 uncharacterized protein FFMR_15758 [Fusarium fujikuroi]SCV57585.1 uncharacterized protein FFB14_15219 [Fusarium fujikuroi]
MEPADVTQIKTRGQHDALETTVARKTAQRRPAVGSPMPTLICLAYASFLVELGEHLVGKTPDCHPFSELACSVDPPLDTLSAALRPAQVHTSFDSRSYTVAPRHTPLSAPKTLHPAFASAQKGHFLQHALRMPAAYHIEGRHAFSIPRSPKVEVQQLHVKSTRFLSSPLDTSTITTYEELASLLISASSSTSEICRPTVLTNRNKSRDHVRESASIAHQFTSHKFLKTGKSRQHYDEISLESSPTS